ncbi:MAG: LysE family transporter [Myxococcota bacterium]
MEPLLSLATGAGLGLAGGLAPGPLTALVFSQTLQYGAHEGAKVSLAPVITDGPLLLLSAFAASWFAGSDVAFAVIGFVGSGFLVWLGLESFRAGPVEVDAVSAPAGGVVKAVLTNLLNPHPYLFWGAVGGPLVARAYEQGGLSVVSFLLGFFGVLCGTKLGMALFVDWARPLLSSRAYVWIMRGLGLMMWFFAAGFFIDAVHRLGLLSG